MDHGGNIREAEARYGFAPGEMLDLSTGICPRPYPIPEHLLKPAGWRELPQREDEEALEAAFRSSQHVPDGAAVLAAPGSQILINHLPLLGKAGPVAIPDPAYSEHATAWEREGYEVLRHPAGDPPPPEAASMAVVQPGNPLGEVSDPDAVLDLVKKAAARDGVVVVDEAFADLDPSISLLPYTGRPGLVVMRSFGKFYGLTGLRLGLAAGHASDIGRLRELLGPWPVSIPALRVGAAALANTEFQEDQRIWILASMSEMEHSIRGLGLKMIGNTGFFALLEGSDAGDLHFHLAKKGIWTRVFDHNKDWLRVGLADGAGLEKLDAALEGWRQVCQ